MKKFGIGILSFNRPVYLRATLQGLKSNDLTDCDVWLFQDGAVCEFTGAVRANQADLDECVKAFKESGFSNVVRHEYNISIARNRLALLQCLSADYSIFMQLEDDVVMARHCVQIMRHLLEQFADKQDMGMIVSGLMDIADNDSLCLYREQLHISCFATRREWFAPVLVRFLQYCEAIGGQEYPAHNWIPEAKALIGSKLPPSSDGGLSWAATVSGRLVWTLGRPRTRGIGVMGMHFRPEIYERLKLGEVVLRDYEGETEVEWQRIPA